MKYLPVALVGAGAWGSRYAAKIATTPGAELRAVIDRDLSRAEAAAAAARDAAAAAGRTDLCVTAVGTDQGALFASGARAVVVAVPARGHGSVARPLVDAGLAVLMEKPFAATLAEADELVALANTRGGVLQAAHLERFNPGVAALRTRLLRPRFVESNRLGPFPGRGTDVDVVLDLMIHDLDLVLSFVDSPLERVSARGVAVVSDEVDIANARLEFADGCVADLTASRVSLKRERKMRIFQDNAYLSLDFAEPSLVVVRREPPSEPGAWAEITAEPVLIEKQDALGQQVASFVNAVVTGGAPAVSASAGRKALEVALRITADIERWRAA